MEEIDNQKKDLVEFQYCTGYRLAYFKHLDRLDKLEFISLFSGDFQGDDKAKCDKDDHPSPQLSCTCGFYSFKNLKKALKERKIFRGSYILEVENYGKIIEHQTGFRSENQVVNKIHIPKKCARLLCYSPTYAVIEIQKNWFSHACERHTRKYKNNFTLSYIENILDIKINLF